jgi:hypothetical protein
LWDDLRECDKEKVQVEEEFELTLVGSMGSHLFIEDDGQECECIVLCVGDDIARISFRLTYPSAHMKQRIRRPKTISRG